MRVRHSFFSERVIVNLEAGCTLFVCDGDEIEFAKAIVEYIMESNPECADDIAEILEQLNQEGKRQ